MPFSKEITWRDLTGNKFSKSLHLAMLSDAKYVCTQRIRRIGESHSNIFTITYDREYAVSWLLRKVCKPLSFLGKEKMLQLIEEAWELCSKESLAGRWEDEG